MKNKLFVLVWVFLGLLFSLGLSLAQVNPQIPKIGKTYWCAEVEDVLLPKEPLQGKWLSVGVRVKFTKTIISGPPGQKLCNCAFEGPTGEPMKFWSKTMSLRLIGIKYSETETNLLEYGGPTPAFLDYDYGGFPVIGFIVTETDLERGYVDVWGWGSKEPLQCRDAVIYASFAIYNQTPYNQQNECHPQSDFKKSFKPKCLEVPKIDIGKIKKGIEKSGEVIKNLPDLEIADLIPYWRISKQENAQAIVYDELIIKISVKNSGNMNIPGFKILVERKWEWETQYKPEKYSKWTYEKNWETIREGIIEVENLKAGETKDVFVFADNSGEPRADCWFRITLDPNNEIAELNEDNNIRSEILFPSHYIHPDKYKKEGKFKPAPAKAK